MERAGFVVPSAGHVGATRGQRLVVQAGRIVREIDIIDSLSDIMRVV